MPVCCEQRKGYRVDGWKAKLNSLRQQYGEYIEWEKLKVTRIIYTLFPSGAWEHTEEQLCCSEKRKKKHYGRNMNIKIIKYCVLSVFLGAVLMVQPSYASKRLALVVGNSNYSEARLANPVNDAKAIAEKLRQLGFSVDLQQNINRKTLRQTIRRFGEQLSSDDIGLFYFAGHGMQVAGENYLIPIGSDISTEDEIPDETVSVNAVLRKMESAKNAVNIVILDACRNNPFKRSFRSSSRGLRRVDGPVGYIIISAPAPGSEADDGAGANGVFTSHLLKHITSPGLTIHQIMNRVRNGVRASTNGKQIPWESSALTGDFYFNNTTPVVANNTETLFWQVVKQENNQHFYQNYLNRYPQGVYKPQAQAAIQRLLGADTGRELREKADYLYFDKHDEKGAFRLYQQAANQGSLSAMASLAKLWAVGDSTGVGKNMKNARIWRNKSYKNIKQLAEQGHVFSQYQLAGIYGKVDKELQLAAHWYRKPAEQGNAIAQVELGLMYHLGEAVEQSDKEALAWFRKAAEQGDTNAYAQVAIGYMYLLGKGVKQSDRKAVAWFQKAVKQNLAEAQVYLGSMYLYGKGVEQSDKEAIKWFRKATKQGLAEAQHQLGYMHQNGKGVKKSDKEAVKWFRQAAEQGFADAQHYLGYMYHNGKGVKKSDKEAVKWFQKAADQGFSDADYYVDILSSSR
jgi:TPR repeat protein